MPYEIKLPKLECSKCGYVWIPKKEKIYQCPKCKTFLERNKPKEKR